MNNNINITLIKSLMGAHDHTKKYVAKELGISIPAFKNTLDGKVDFKARQAKKIEDLYQISIRDSF